MSHDQVTHEPVDAITERLNDPAVAASLVTLLDNAELLSTLVLGLGGFLERGDMIMDAVAESVTELKSAGAGRPEGMPTLSETAAVLGQLNAATPVLGELLESPLVSHEMIGLLSDISEAATEGAAAAKANETSVGTLGVLKSLRDDDVQRGLGLVIEIARALGRRMA